jgi:hypothetical protein
MITDAALLAAIDKHSRNLNLPEGSDLRRKAVLAAITYTESSWGARGKAALFEKAYYRGGKFYRDHVKHLVHVYESLASCSYGPFQILFVAAYEVGFRGHPWELIDPDTCAEWSVMLLNRRCFNVWVTAPTPELEQPASKIEQVADFWNSGSWRDRFKPEAYITKVVDGYKEAIEFYEGTEDEGPPAGQSTPSSLPESRT